MMYICEECGLVFSEPKTYHEGCAPGCAVGESGFTHSYKACPNCEGYYEEAMECQGCGGFVSIQSDDPFCVTCTSNILSKFIKLMQDNFREDEYDVIYNHIESFDPYKKKGE